MSSKASTPVVPHAKIIDQLHLPEMRVEQLTFFSEIGKGRYKTVSSACHSRHGKVAALRYNADASRNEADILALLSKNDGSAYVPEVYGFYRERSGLVLAQELSSFGSVRSALQDPEIAATLTASHKLHMAEQFAEAVAFLELVHVVHTDLACRNFLVFELADDPECTKVKLTDFASSLALPPNASHAIRKIPQATRWVAPETAASNKWSHKTDIWSLGVTFWELFTGGMLPWTSYSKRSEVAQKLRELFENSDSCDVLRDLNSAFAAPDPGMCPLSAYRVLQSCLQVEAAARPTAKQLCTALGQSPSEASSCNEVPTSSALETIPRNTLCRLPGTPPVVAPPAHESSQQAPSPPGPTPQLQSSPVVKATAKTGTAGTFMTPPTRCPSTPECASEMSYQGVEAHTLVLNAVTPSKDAGSIRSSSTASLVRTPKRITLKQQQILSDVRSLCTSSKEHRSESLENVKAFLSSTEAICGLSLEKQLLLRERLAAAEVSKEESIIQAPRRLVYQDTMIPLSFAGRRFNA